MHLVLLFQWKEISLLALCKKSLQNSAPLGKVSIFPRPVWPAMFCRIWAVILIVAKKTLKQELISTAGAVAAMQWGTASATLLGLQEELHLLCCCLEADSVEEQPLSSWAHEQEERRSSSSPESPFSGTDLFLPYPLGVQAYTPFLFCCPELLPTPRKWDTIYVAPYSFPRRRTKLQWVGEE